MTVSQSPQTITNSNSEYSVSITTTKTAPVPDQYELYNLIADPLEEKNLTHPTFKTPESIVIKRILYAALQEQL